MCCSWRTDVTYIMEVRFMMNFAEKLSVAVSDMQPTEWNSDFWSSDGSTIWAPVSISSPT
jgi:hypothetical protein